MTLSRIYMPSTRVEHYELDGLLRVLDRAIAEPDEGQEQLIAYYIGAQIALQIIRYHERLETPEDFMFVFNNYLSRRENDNAEDR